MNRTDEARLQDSIYDYIAAQGEGKSFTAEELRRTTTIRGWLSLLCFAMVAGGVFSVGSTICEVVTQFDDFGRNLSLAAVSLGAAAISLALGVTGTVAFKRRWPTAVFWAKTFCLDVLISNVIEAVACGGDAGTLFENKTMYRGIFWGAIWFCYLTWSKQVAVVIPKSYRRVGLGRWIVAVLAVASPFVLLFASFATNFVAYWNIPDIKAADLQEGEATDGHVVFAVPEGMTSELKYDTKGGGIAYCEISGENFGGLVASWIDSDASWTNFERIAEGFCDPELMTQPHEVVSSQEVMINGGRCFRRTTGFDNGYYWHFNVFFNETDAVRAVVSVYSAEKDDPRVLKILESLRFSK